MKNLLFAGVAGLSLLAVAPASAASDSMAPVAEKGSVTDLGGVFEGRKGGGGGGMHGPRPGMHGPKPGGHGPMPGMGPKPGGYGPMPGMQHRWGHRMNGRWHAGFNAPGGWGGYRIPFGGFQLPTYWIQPTYRISNYQPYGLYAPPTGYGWSRYYDDAVLSDPRGYVQDYRSGIPWDRYEGGYAPDGYGQPDYGPAVGADRGVYYGDDRVYSGAGYPAPAPAPQPYEPAPAAPQGYGAPYSAAPYGPPPGPGYQSRYGFERYEQCLQNRGLTGGIIGAVVGAVAGNRIAGRGDRLPGSLIGGGLGAIAGASIEKATKKCKKYLPREDAYYYGNGGYPAGPAYAPPPPPQPQPYPYYPQGYYYYPQPAPIVTTVTITPAVTTTTTVTEEVYYETVAVKKKAVRKWKPKPRAKPKPRCHCH
jgi:hypothetical protein